MYPKGRILGIQRGQIQVWLRRSLDLFFPPRCVACSRLGGWFCDDCLASVAPIPQPICPRCGQPTSTAALCSQCRLNPAQLDGIRALAIHDGALRQAIHHLKYNRRKELADPLGRMLFEYWSKVKLAVDVVVPVPLHESRQKERGYNQAGLLAAELVKHARLPLDQTHLIRTKATPPQVGLGVDERKANVRDAFEWAGDDLNGVCVLLIDDVCTTGSTLEACAHALRQGGANSVWALTLARPHERLG